MKCAKTTESKTNYDTRWPTKQLQTLFYNTKTVGNTEGHKDFQTFHETSGRLFSVVEVNLNIDLGSLEAFSLFSFFVDVNQSTLKNRGNKENLTVCIISVCIICFK